MGKSRLQLHEKLCDLLGSRNCYFCPPTGLNMKYPCIRYETSKPSAKYADNKIYLFMQHYTLTVIDYDPDTDIPNRLMEIFPYCSFDRAYQVDELNHFVLSLFY